MKYTDVTCPNTKPAQLVFDSITCQGWAIFARCIIEQCALSKVRWTTPNDQTAQNMKDPMCPIDDFCSALDTKCADCIGFLEEDDYRFILYHDASALTGTSMPTTTLHDLLEGGNVLTRRKWYCPALMLAVSFQRLGATPWVNTRLRKDKIVFLSSSGGLQKVVLERPYMIQEMSHS